MPGLIESPKEYSVELGLGAFLGRWLVVEWDYEAMTALVMSNHASRLEADEHLALARSGLHDVQLWPHKVTMAGDRDLRPW